ncbi:MAG TPA: NAD(P)/FAD-dependent oxidoreductase [Tepidisphaeraceae bacterium]|jgi:thioredoxin reductase (NADPH)
MISDIVIVGAGPTGLFGAFYAGFRGMSVKIVDSLSVLGGQLATLYPEKFIYDVPAFPKVRAKDLVANLVTQAMQYKPALSLGERVQRLDYDPEQRLYSLHTDRQSHITRTILIASGIGSFQPKRLALENAGQFERSGVYYTVGDVEDFRNKRLLIVGGGDSAVDWANALCDVAQSITLIHRRDTFRAHEKSVEKLMCSSVRVLTFHELKAIEGNDRVERAVIYDNRSQAEQTLEVDAILVNIGFESTAGPLAHWELKLRGAAIEVDATMCSNRPGIYAAGDSAWYPAKIKLIATAFGEACNAINHAKHFIDPKARVFPGHSTDVIKG